jgi:hypothetical protein
MNKRISMKRITWRSVGKTRHLRGVVLSDVEGTGVRGNYAVDEYPKGEFAVIFWKKRGGDIARDIAVVSSLAEGKRYAEIFDSQ